MLSTNDILPICSQRSHYALKVLSSEMFISKIVPGSTEVAFNTPSQGVCVVGGLSLVNLTRKPGCDRIFREELLYVTQATVRMKIVKRGTI